MTLEQYNEQKRTTHALLDNIILGKTPVESLHDKIRLIISWSESVQIYDYFNHYEEWQDMVNEFIETTDTATFSEETRIMWGRMLSRLEADPEFDFRLPLTSP